MGRSDGPSFPIFPVAMEFDKHSGYRKTTLVMRIRLVYLGKHYLDTQGRRILGAGGTTGPLTKPRRYKTMFLPPTPILQT